MLLPEIFHCPHSRYIPALGIMDDVEALGLKGTKKKKGRKMDEDFIVS
jgi:hypothetical protein